MLMYYAFTPDSVFKLVPPNGSEPTWQTSMLYSDIFLLVYVYETICMVICPLQDSSQSFYGPGYPKMHLMDEGPGAILSFKTFLSFINRLLVTYITSSWRLAWGGTLSAPFWGLCQKLSLSPLYFITQNKTLLQKALSDQALSLALDWILLLQRPRILGSFRSATTFQKSWERRMELEESTFLTSDYTTKLQSSRQYGTKTEI